MGGRLKISLTLVLTATSCGACQTQSGQQPPKCDETHELCSCGAVGCPCDAGACLSGTCNEDSNTCVVEEEAMMFVPSGEFWMGCREGVDTDDAVVPCDSEELPYRRVHQDGFWIDKYEVQKSQYAECMTAGVCEAPVSWDEEWYHRSPEGVVETIGPGAPDMPAASVNWTQAGTFCEWTGKRLPTEAEWEKAARGTDGRKYPWGDVEPTCDHANNGRWDPVAGAVGPRCPWQTDIYGSVTPVGYFPLGTSPYGALDMAGNVSEWASDGFPFGQGYGSLSDTNPFTEPNGDGTRAYRGANWQSAHITAAGYRYRTSVRGRGGVAAADFLTRGIRCARDAE